MAAVSEVTRQDDATQKDVRYKQYLTFFLGNEMFAIDVLRGREVLDYTRVTRIPRTPVCIAGVINLRGSVVPVIDLREKLIMKGAKETENMSIIIVEIDHEGEILEMGALVDDVKEVVRLNIDEIESAPKVGMNINTDLILGIGKSGENFIILLDIDKVFSPDELIEKRNRALKHFVHGNEA